MADPVVVGSHLEFTIVSTLGPQTALNILHALVLGPIVGGPTTQDMATAFDVLIHVNYKQTMTQAAVYRGVGCRLIDNPPTRPMFFSTAFLGPGTSGLFPLATQTRGLIALRTQFAGRKERGRMYFPFPSTGGINADGTVLAGLQALYAVFGGQIVPGPVILTNAGVSAAMFFGVRNRATTHIETYDAFVVRSQFATQRRSGGLGRVNPPPF